MQAFPAHARLSMLDTHVQTHGKTRYEVKAQTDSLALASLVPRALRGLGTRLNLALAMYYQTYKTSNLSSFSGPWPLQVADTFQPNGPELHRSAMYSAICSMLADS